MSKSTSTSSTFIVNEYIINRKRIGKGSFSTIYKGYSTKNNYIYAIKEIPIDKKQNKSNVKRELNVLKNLDNPYIIKLHDVIIDTNYNNVYFILDYYSKGDLSKFLNHKPLKEKYCRKYMKQLALGLEYLLNKNILHRDLKPQNILLTNEYNIKITDFGFAKKINKNVLITTLCGSPMYMAPEIINKKDYDIKSDLWSVGIILYEMIYGYVPFNVGNFLELIKNINNKDIIFYHKDIKPTSDCLDLMKKLLTKNPINRINWYDFFNDIWFLNDELMIQENNLLEISFSNSNTLPNIKKIKNEKQFCSFTYESYIETKSQKLIDLNEQNNQHNPTKSNLDNIHIPLNGSNNKLKKINIFYNNEFFQKNKDNNNFNIDNINFLDSLENDNLINENKYAIKSNNKNESDFDYESYYDSNYESNSESEYLSANEIEDSIENNNISINLNYKKSDPINIINKRINNSDEFEIIDKPLLKPQSLPVSNKTLTESFKVYLYSSINLIKQSYNYISSNKSI